MRTRRVNRIFLALAVVLMNDILVVELEIKICQDPTGDFPWPTPTFSVGFLLR